MFWKGLSLGDMGAGWMAEQTDYRAVSQCWLVGKKCQRVLSLNDSIFRGHLVLERLQETQWPFHIWCSCRACSRLCGLREARTAPLSQFGWHPGESL